MNSIRLLGYLALIYCLDYDGAFNLNIYYDENFIFIDIIISDYSDNAITDLHFAHKDAEVFADFLASPDGGSVPSENIKLLTNSNATMSNIYASMTWLEEEVNKDDLVYFYFSGHGDLGKGLYKLGFLLAHDTPNLMYKNNSVRVEDVNILANNLSVLKDASVVLVTDACHSGKLSGSDNLRSATLGDRLTKVKEGEIRIASCESDQESKESPAWGGGRGAFSYYFIKGLQGLADEMGNGNKEVTLGELDKYLSKKVKKDVNRIMRADQNPVVEGKSEKKVAIVNTLEGVSASDGDASRATLGGGKSVSHIRSVQDQYFEALSIIDLKNELEFRDLLSMNEDELMDFILDRYPVERLTVDSTGWSDKLIEDTRVRNTFKQQLGAELHNITQKAINAYLTGDKDELQKRRFYNVENADFAEYPYILDIAMKLTSPNSYLYHMMEVKKYYFLGVSSRLSLYKTANPDSLLNVAFEAQKKAVALDDKAAYIHNELGVLYNLKQDNETAIAKFKQAQSIAPDWVVPINNLGRISFYNGDFNTSDSLAFMAVSMKPDYVNAHLLRGDNALQLNNFLQAKDSYLRALEYNKSSYQAYDGLGEVYMMTTDYESANYHYQMAEDIRRGLFEELNINMPVPLDDIESPIDVVLDGRNALIYCDVGNDEIPLEDVLVNFSLGYRSYESGNFEIAKDYFEKVILADPDEPLSHYYLGQIKRKEQDLIAAEVYFILADELFLNLEELELYSDRMNEIQLYQKCDFRAEYLSASYNAINNKYLLAEVYDSLGHYTQAEDIYYKLIEDNLDSYFKEYLMPYKLLWNLYARRGLYEDAEEVILQYCKHQNEDGTRELYRFYESMINESYDVLDYEYKAGLLLYGLTKQAKDSLLRIDDEGEILVDRSLEVLELMSRGGSVEDLVLAVPGTNDTIYRSFEIVGYLQRAIGHLSNVNMDRDSTHVGDVYSKLGELYAMDNKWDQVLNHYILAYDFNPDNATPATELLPLLKEKNQILVAYNLLKEMEERGQCKYLDLVDLTDNYVLSSEYYKADKLFERLDAIYPIAYDFLNQINAKRYLLSEDYEIALENYTDLNTDEIDNVSHNYTLSRLHAAMGNKEEAKEFLADASTLGFNYYWVLEKDPLLKELRDTELYKSMVKEFYPYPHELK